VLVVFPKPGQFEKWAWKFVGIYDQFKAYMEKEEQEKMSEKLTHRITELLKSGRSTPHKLAEDLAVHIDVVESALRRLRKKEIVRPIEYCGMRGFYELIQITR
jgi:hypothetical protein